MASKHIIDRYEHMIFPEYKFREYPKTIKLLTGKTTIVENAVQERELLNATEQDATNIAVNLDQARRDKEEQIYYEDDKNTLLAKAGDLGLVMHRNSSVQTIKDAIIKAQADLEK